MAPLRVVNKFLSLFSGVKFTLTSIVQAIRATAKRIVFRIDENETGVFEADGTGVLVLGAGKRGKELEVLAQRKKCGGIRIAGRVISSFKMGWQRLFSKLVAAWQRFKEIVLVTDGDPSPLKAVADRVKVNVQRCLFHIPHEMKYMLWKDRVKRKRKRIRYSKYLLNHPFPIQGREFVTLPKDLFL